MNKKFGFTLAEVLITLGIIGVVAAMTIPTLMNSTGSSEYKSGMKKLLSVLNQAITINVAIDGNDFSALNSGNTANSATILSLYTTRMSLQSTTDAAVSNLGAAFNNGSNYTIFLNDGMVVSFPKAATTCTTASGASSPCSMVVDVNGVKKPNKLSVATVGATTANVYDEFVLDFYNQQVMPHDEKAKYVLYN